MLSPISVRMDYVMLVTVVLAFWTTDVQSPVATGLAMPLVNSYRIAGKIFSSFLTENYVIIINNYALSSFKFFFVISLQKFPAFSRLRMC